MDTANQLSQAHEVMDASTQIRRFHDFFEKNYYGELVEHVRKGLKFIVIDFAVLSSFDPELAELVLDQPEEVLKAAQISIEEFDLPGNASNFNVRLRNISASQEILVRNIRSNHITKLLSIKGVVRQKSDVRPQITSTKFECPSCGNVISILQLDKKMKEPTKCGCGRKGKFHLLSKELVDAQGIVLEEASEDLEGGEQPKRINVLLKNDLVSPLSEKRTNPGNKIILVGELKEVPIILRTGGQSTRFELMIEANYIEPVQEEFAELEISEEEVEEIKALSQDPKLFDKIVSSIAPSIYGHDKIKLALAVQLVGGVRKIRDDGAITRGDIHILLIGDPGAGKSMMLKRVNVVAPKSRFISGKGASGAGLTASVVRDEFLQGWSLEAGALVLANKGICCIDELDKMSPDDRAAMHEALEGQSYHHDTEILLSDGKTKKIGELVDSMIKKRGIDVIKGVECEFLLDPDLEVISTDFNKLFKKKVMRVSRHKKPNHYFRISYSNGRSITVTPEHPVFIFHNGKITEAPAVLVKKGMVAPAPRHIPTSKDVVNLDNSIIGHRNCKDISFPKTLDSNLAKLLGYIISEGHVYQNKKLRYAEIGISNTDKLLIQECDILFKKLFKTTTNINLQKKKIRKKAKLDLYTVRCCSKPLLKYFRTNFPELVFKAPKKRVPNCIKSSPLRVQKNFLICAFRGDGFVDRDSFGFSTSSPAMAHDFQDMLLQLGINSIIQNEKRENHIYYKVRVSGSPSLALFNKKFILLNDKRKNHSNFICKRSLKKANYRDLVPYDTLISINELLKELKLSNGYFVSIIKKKQNSNIEVVKKHIVKIKDKIDYLTRNFSSLSTRKIRRLLNLQVKDIADFMEVSPGTVYNLEKRNDKSLTESIISLSRKRLLYLKKKFNYVSRFIYSDIKFVEITNIEKINDISYPYVYDVTVAPNQTFISQGIILHNTITISKANIQATLRAETTVLAAANPKFGRFDPTDNVANQIDLPPTLINRFDLIFPVKDLPDEANDEKLASFVLSLHQNPHSQEPDISTNLLRKYIAYAKRYFKPQLTDSAIKAIKKYYLKVRGSGSKEEGGLRAVPISARQLEGLIRMSEAMARLRLSEVVTDKDAKKAIDLLHYCLTLIAMDESLGTFDIDRIATGISTSQRSKIVTIKEIIVELESKIGKTIPIEDISSSAQAHGLKESDVEETIERLKRSGDIFEPKHGMIQRI